MTIFYFGERWDAPMLDAPEDDSPPPVHCPTPVGKFCGTCNDVIINGDRGQLIPHVTDDLSAASTKPHHIECLWLTTWGHIEGVCGCTGFPPSRHARETLLARLNERRANSGLGPLW